MQNVSASVTVTVKTVRCNDFVHVLPHCCLNQWVLDGEFVLLICADINGSAMHISCNNSCLVSSSTRFMHWLSGVCDSDKWMMAVTSIVLSVLVHQCLHCSVMSACIRQWHETKNSSAFHLHITNSDPVHSVFPTAFVHVPAALIPILSLSASAVVNRFQKYKELQL